MLTPSLNIGGAEKIIIDIIRSLKSTYLFSVCAAPGYYSDILVQNHIKQYDLPYSGKKNIVTLFILYFQICKIIKTEQPDIVHTHHRMLSFIVGLIPSKSFFHIHTMHCFFNDKKKLTRLIMPDHTVAVGQSVYQSIIKNFGYKKNSCSVIRNGIQEISQKKQHYSSDIKKIVCVGRLDKIKGQIYLIQAISILKEMNLSVHFIGDGPDRNYLKNEAKRLSVSDQISFLGFILNASEILADYDIVISPSLSEGLPLVPMEALSCGVPVIATDIEGNSEIITNRKNGLLVPPKNPQALAEAISWSIQHPEQMATYAITGLDEVTKKYSIEKMATQYKKLYNASLTD